MLEHGRDRALARAVFEDRADNLEHRLRGGHLRDERAARCAENDVHNVVDAVQLHLFERAGTIVQPLRAVRERLVLSLRLHGSFQTQGTAGVFKKQSLAEFRIRIHIEKTILDLRRQCRIKQQTFVEILHGFLLPNVTIYAGAARNGRARNPQVSSATGFSGAGAALFSKRRPMPVIALSRNSRISSQLWKLYGT